MNDDNDRADTEWLQTALGRGQRLELGCGFYIEFWEHSVPDLNYTTGNPHDYYGHSASTDITPWNYTKGEVRRLCAALGKPLTV